MKSIAKSIKFPCQLVSMQADPANPPRARRVVVGSYREASLLARAWKAQDRPTDLEAHAGMFFTDEHPLDQKLLGTLTYDGRAWSMHDDQLLYDPEAS